MWQYQDIFQRWAGAGGKTGKALFSRIGNSPQNRYKNLLFYPYHFSVGDYLPGKGSRPPKYH